ncbi:MAG: tRNA (adenosine(37)-N6)-threonylcarbamoyltransferase complex transferase subunit TsaD [Nitrospirae bacterium GWC2_57_9]|nr:MAG: tRNA (adenosine(37)-N6)-threonylcarbamoyltransferase complex transferase subunit TsaD [Nitrospirae bacterium GWC2_57_9]
MLTLGIETSCDETAAAVLRDAAVLSNIVSSQIEVHKKYGGVVPELASREHLRNLMPVVREALAAASVGLADIDLVAVTYAPGLIGALLVGVSAAKAIAYARDIPFIGVHHGEAHILAAHLEYPDIGYPYVALLVSGGHTALYHVKGLGDYRLLGQTRDDAAGEAYDKVAKLLDLEYPGGPVLDRLAREGNPGSVKFPRVQLEGFDFSFSGLKTAVRNHVALFKSRDQGLTPPFPVSNVAASFQAAVVDMLVERTMKAVADTGVDRIVIAGGVAANSSLRSKMRERAEERKVRLYLPGMGLCIDNAAMVALAGYLHFERGERSGLDLNPRPTMPL